MDANLTYRYALIDPRGRVTDLPEFTLDVDLLSRALTAPATIVKDPMLSEHCGSLLREHILRELRVVAIRDAADIANARYLRLSPWYLTHGLGRFVFDREVWRLTAEDGTIRAGIDMAGKERPHLTACYREFCMRS